MSNFDKSIFAVVCNAIPTLHAAKFFKTKESARKHLKDLANERRNKFGISFFEENEDKFSYVFGWEEHRVSCAVVELPVED